MKKGFAVMTVLALAVLFVGCKKSESTSPVVTQESASPVVQETAPKYTVLVDSVLLDGSYWTLNDEGKMDWVQYLVPGVSVQAYATADPLLNPEYEMIKDAIRTTDGAKRNFYHVYCPEMREDYWVQEYSIVLNAYPAVIYCEEDGKVASLYKTPDLAATGNRNLDDFTIVACINEEPDTLTYDRADKFSHVQIYDKKDGTITGYVRNSFINTEEVMVSYAQMDNKRKDKEQVKNYDVAVLEELYDSCGALANYMWR